MSTYAHSKINQPIEKWQPLDQHLANVANLAANFAEKFQSQGWAYNAAYLHDLGKALPAFQSYLLKENGLEDPNYDSGNHNHSSAGAAFAMQKYGQCIGKIYAYIVAGHHTGLPDWFSDRTGNAALSVRLAEGKDNLAKIAEYAEANANNLQDSLKPDFVNPENLSFWIRMMFSCIVDADSLDSEAFESPEKSSTRINTADMFELKRIFDAYMGKISVAAKNTQVNKIRSEVLDACRRKALGPPGIFSLSVPTGGGKTLSSMAFALNHAVQHGKKRIIYVIPYTSIIEQTAETFKKIFGEEQVLEHHCNIDTVKMTPLMELASENWDAPVIVTTNVQFFESLYAAQRSRCRKLHNIVNSVIILDEAQLLPPKYLAPCASALKELSKNYHTSIILSTATQPTLKWLDEVSEVMAEPNSLYDRLKRVEIIFPESLKERMSWEQVAEKLKPHDQVLCIVNSRKDCHDLHKLMPPETIHLSALMCAEHRSAVITGIKCKLNGGEPVRVISTQLVEAGVDMDFPVVYRALAGLDSIAQAAGRCNREGKLSKGKVVVFVPPKPAAPGILLKGENTTIELAATGKLDIDSPDTFKKYFSLFYNSLNDTGENDFKKDLVKDGFNIAFRSYAQEFKIIDDKDQQPVIVRFKESNELITDLKKIGRPVRDIMRKLQRYTVNLHTRAIARMLANGQIEEIFPDSGIFAQTMPGCYSSITGLEVFADNLPSEDLVI